MKKIITLLAALSLIIVLAACGATPAEPQDPYATEPTTELPDWVDTHENEFNLTVALLEDEAPGDFAYLLNYSDVMEARDGMAPGDSGDTLRITTEVPLRNFAVQLLRNDILGDDIIFVPAETFGEIDELSPGESFVIQNFRSHGMMPASGVTFVDEEGTQRYFALWQTQSGYGEPYYLVEFENQAGELPPATEPNGAGEAPAPAALELTIERLEGDPADFDHVFDYSQGQSDGLGDTLVIRANLPLLNFAVQFFTNEMRGDEVTFLPVEAFAEVGVLPAGDGFVITHYLSRGTLPASGVTFVDEDGTQRLFAIVQNQGYPETGAAYLLIELENRTGEQPPVWHYAR